jgi:hypothetical protein
MNRINQERLVVRFSFENKSNNFSFLLQLLLLPLLLWSLIHSILPPWRHSLLTFQRLRAELKYRERERERKATFDNFYRFEIDFSLHAANTGWKIVVKYQKSMQRSLVHWWMCFYKCVCTLWVKLAHSITFVLFLFLHFMKFNFLESKNLFYFHRNEKLLNELL